MLKRHGIDVYVDLRKIAMSRQRPEFNADNIRDWLAADYTNMGGLLGGRRPKQPVDPTLNAGWNNVSFKNFADYTLSPAYRQGIEELVELASQRTVVICCCESVPWRCHRSLIANTLVSAGHEVANLINGATRPHQLNAFGAHAVVRDGQVYYPAQWRLL